MKMFGFEPHLVKHAARGEVSQQGPHTMAEEYERRTGEKGMKFLKELVDQLVEASLERLAEASFASRQLDGAQFDIVGKPSMPISIGGCAAAGKGKTKQSDPRTKNDAGPLQPFAFLSHQATLLLILDVKLADGTDKMIRAVTLIIRKPSAQLICDEYERRTLKHRQMFGRNSAKIHLALREFPPTGTAGFCDFRLVRDDRQVTGIGAWTIVRQESIQTFPR